MEEKSKKSKTSKKKTTTLDTTKDFKRMAVIPYVHGISERIQRIFKKYNISTAMKPHQTLRRLLVHPKDKRKLEDNANCVYEIPCKSCDSTYIGETGRLFGTRLSEHKSEVDKICKKKYTRAERKASETEQNKSAITDHVAINNHLIDWEEAKVIDKEEERMKRWIKESIWIRKRGRRNLMNRDEGTYNLSNLYNPLLATGNPVATKSGNTASRGSSSGSQL